MGTTLIGGVDSIAWGPVLSGYNSRCPNLSENIKMSIEVQQSDRPDLDRSQKRNVKLVLLDEGRKFLRIFVYLSVVFGLLVLHEWVVLTSEHLSYRFYGFALINALVLAKIMLLAEGLHFAERLQERPLVFSIAYKALAFTVLLMGTYVIEEMAVGMWHGSSAAQAIPKIGGGSIGEIAAVTTIMFFALIPYFAFRELRRAYGDAEFNALMFTRGMKALR